VGRVHVLVSNFLGVCFYQKLAKSDEISRRCDEIKKGDVFSETQCICACAIINLLTQIR